jgi:hypothetical protein
MALRQRPANRKRYPTAICVMIIPDTLCGALVSTVNLKNFPTANKNASSNILTIDGREESQIKYI